MKKIFLHGLDSSGSGTKGQFFQKNFPEVLTPDFDGSLEKRIQHLHALCKEDNHVILIGSSFGGLMATCFASAHRERVKKVILMAPALNFPGFLVPKVPIHCPAFVLVGLKDTVTPAKKVVPLAKKTFANLEIVEVDEDHLLHDAFRNLDWKKLFDEKLD